jgi:internalin A
MKKFKVNEYIELRLEHDKTEIYVAGENFRQCKILLLNIPVKKISTFDDIESIDEAVERLDKEIENEQHNRKVPPEVEFWGHCSNLQVWAENNYDTRLIHTNLAFPLLKKLYEFKDLIAIKVFKEEIAKRLLSGHSSVLLFLFNEGYLEYFTKEEFNLLIEKLKTKCIFDYFTIIISYKELFNSLLKEKNKDSLGDFTALNEILEIIKKNNEQLIEQDEKIQFIPVKRLNPEDFIYLNDGGKYDEKYSGNEKMEFTHKNNRITGISLHSRLSGNFERIPDSLNKFSSLEILDLSSCYLKTNSFPIDLSNLHSIKELYVQYNELENIPQAIYKLKSLKKIIARKNHIKNIEKSISNLDNLEVLLLDDNFIETLPDSIGKLKKLKKLNLAFNKIKKIPNSIGNLLDLEELDLNYALSRKIPEGEEDHNFPDSFSQLENLKYLNTSGNYWRDDVEEKISFLPKLERLVMDAADIPNSFQNLSNLKELNIIEAAHNWINFPKAITKLKSLENFSAKYIKAENLPESFGNLISLRILDLKNCNFKTLPNSFGNLINLERLNLEQNRHLESLPKSFGNLVSLKKLTLSDNRLSNLPESFGNLKSLEELNLNACKLKYVPLSFGNLKTIQKLYLSENSLEHLPKSIGNLNSLQFLFLNKNPLKDLPKTIGELKSLIELRLESCNLETLPKSVEGLKSLKTLILRYNRIKNLPESIGNLESLEELDLAGNELNIIPNSTCKLQSLTKLNLAGNDLKEIPRTLKKLNNLKKLIIGNNEKIKVQAIELFKDRLNKNLIEIN